MKVSDYYVKKVAEAITSAKKGNYPGQGYAVGEAQDVILWAEWDDTALAWAISSAQGGEVTAWVEDDEWARKQKAAAQAEEAYAIAYNINSKLSSALVQAEEAGQLDWSGQINNDQWDAINGIAKKIKDLIAEVDTYEAKWKEKGNA